MKQGKKLLILTLVLVVLAVGAWLLMNMPAEEEQAPSEIKVLSMKPSDVTSIGWEFEGEWMQFDYDGKLWHYTEDPLFPVDAAMLDSLIKTLTDMTTETIIEQPKDVEQYGLTDDAVTIRINGTAERTLKIGNTARYGGDNYLGLDDGNVYLVDSSIRAAFRKELYEVLREERLPDFSGTILEGNSLSFTKCVNYNADEEALSQYGLTDPVTLSVVCKDGTNLNLQFAQIEDGTCYIKLAESKMVYDLPASTFQALVILTQS